MGIAQISSEQKTLIDTKYGKYPVGPFSSYQLAHTESKFEVCLKISTVARSETSSKELLL